MIRIAVKQLTNALTCWFKPIKVKVLPKPIGPKKSLRMGIHWD